MSEQVKKGIQDAMNNPRIQEAMGGAVDVIKDIWGAIMADEPRDPNLDGSETRERPNSAPGSIDVVGEPVHDMPPSRSTHVSPGIAGTVYCEQCGASCRESSKFCRSCGAKVCD